MDNTTFTARTIEDLNEENIRKLAAPIVFVVILLIFGVPGNFVVLLVYGKKNDKCVYRSIIWNLALADMTFCTFGIPFNIARIVHYYTFEGYWVCKIFSSLLVFGIMYSTHLLMLLSLHRFRQVCMPLKRQITLRNVKYCVIACFLISFILSSPQIVLEEMEYPVLEYNLTASICPITSSDPSVFWIVNNIILLFVFLFYTTLLFVIYLMIGRRVYTQRDILSRHETTEAHRQRSSFESKMTKIACTISVVFAVSYLPLFVLKVAKEKISEDNLSAFEFSLLRIAERLYMVNHVSNPFVYAIFDNRFRHPVRYLLSFRSRTSEEESSNRVTPRTSATC